MKPKNKPHYRIEWIYDYMYWNTPVIGYRIIPLSWLSNYCRIIGKHCYQRGCGWDKSNCIGREL